MGDLFKKVSSLGKSSPKSSEQLIPGLTPEITPPPPPIPPDAVVPPIPPFILADGAGAAHTPSISPPPAPLNRETVLQRDEVARVFEPSPFSQQLSQSQPSRLSPAQRQDHQVQLQRHHLRDSSGFFRGKYSNNWPSDVKREVYGQGRSMTSYNSSANCIDSMTKIFGDTRIDTAGRRSRPATTFEEMGVDGETSEVPKKKTPRRSSSLPLDGASLAVLEGSARAFQTPTTIFSPTKLDKRMRTTGSLRNLKCGDEVSMFRGLPGRVEFREDSRTPMVSGEAMANADYEGLWDSEKPFDSLQNADRCENGENPTPYRLRFAIPRQHDMRDSCASIGVRRDHKPTNDKAVNGAIHGFVMLPNIAVSQMDGSVESRGHSAQVPELNPNSREEQPIDLEQDFGPFEFQYRSAGESTIRMIEEGLARGKKRKVHRVKYTLRTRIKNFIRRIIPGPGLRSVPTGTVKKRGHVKKGMQTISVGDYAEDSGVREAVGVTRSWKKLDLLITYILLFVLATFFHLGSSLSPMLLNASAEDLSKPQKIVPSISPLEYELTWTGLIIADMVGILIFAKLSNAYSRPCALLISLIGAFSGLMRVSYYGTKWVDLAVGLVVFSFGKSGVLIVLYVMIADMSDLRWRALCSWGMDWGIGVSVWSAPLVGGFIRYITAPSAGRLYFSIGMPLAVAVVLTTYVFLQKAKFGGFIPEVAYSSKRRWWSIMGVAQKILHTAEKLDIIGISLWTLGSGLFLSSSLISYECKIWEWRLGLVLGGALFTALFIVWELHLNELVRRAMSLKLARNAGLVRSDMSSKNRRKTWFFGLAASGRDTPPAMGLEQWENSHKFEFGGPKQPLIRLRLIRSRSISLGALVGFLANFVLKIGIYSEGDPVGLLPTHKEDVGLNARIFLQNMAITSKIFASLIVALYIRSSQKPKCLVVTGLVIILISIVAICFIGEPGIFGLYRIVPQILFGIGAGFAWIGLLVRVQSGCSQHTDVAMATALLVTCNKLGDIAGGIVKRIIKASLIKYLAHGELAQVDDPTYSGWAALLATTVSVAVFNIFLAAFGLEEIVIGEMKQKVSGVIFGIGDPLPKKGNDTGDSTSQDPRTFYTPTTSSDGGAQQHRRPCNLAVGEVSVNESGTLNFSVLSSDASRRQFAGKSPNPKIRFREPSRLQGEKKTHCQIGELESYSSEEHAPGKAFPSDPDHNDIKPGSKTVFGEEESYTPNFVLDTDLGSTIFIDDGIQSGEGNQNGVSGTMQVVDGGYFTYDGSRLVRKLRKPSFVPSTRFRDSRARPNSLSSRSAGEGVSKEEMAELQTNMDTEPKSCDQSPTSTHFASASHIISEAERLRKKNSYILPKDLSPICESLSGSLASPSKSSAGSHVLPDSVADIGEKSSSHCSKLFIHSNVGQLDVGGRNS